jgi:membrane-bound serine protease (ClpP class)
MNHLRPIGVLWLLLGMAVTARAAEVGLITIDGAIGPATASYIARAIRIADAHHDTCLIVELDTPGGLLDSMKKIIESFYASPVPTVVYVSPAGASAASAGCFITLAADVAAMAPSTTIGAAHPVELGAGGVEKLDAVMKEKLENFASSYIEAIAQKRGHNVEWAKGSVLKSASITDDEALKLNVVNLIARDLPDLLRQLNGRNVEGKVLDTAGAMVVRIPMSAGEAVFQMLWHPEVMLILMLVAIYGLIGELSHPGAILPGVVGGIALILTLYLAAVLPINVTGLALIGLALVLFAVDIFTPTHGILTFGGIAAFFLGALMLFNHAGPGFHLSLAYIIPATLVTAAFFVFVAGAGIRAQWLPVRAGVETMLGKSVPALTSIDQARGQVFAEGERWNAVSDTPIETGQRVEIVGLDGLTLKVKLDQTTKTE